MEVNIVEYGVWREEWVQLEHSLMLARSQPVDRDAPRCSDRLLPAYSSELSLCIKNPIKHSFSKTSIYISNTTASDPKVLEWGRWPRGKGAAVVRQV